MPLASPSPRSGAPLSDGSVSVESDADDLDLDRPHGQADLVQQPPQPPVEEARRECADAWERGLVPELVSTRLDEVRRHGLGIDMFPSGAGPWPR